MRIVRDTAQLSSLRGFTIKIEAMRPVNSFIWPLCWKSCLELHVTHFREKSCAKYSTGLAYYSHWSTSCCDSVVASSFAPRNNLLLYT